MEIINNNKIIIINNNRDYQYRINLVYYNSWISNNRMYKYNNMRYRQDNNS
jgi:hypothetical protein